MPIFNTLTSVAAPLDIMNVDTDMIIPKQVRISRSPLRDGWVVRRRQALASTWGGGEGDDSRETKACPNLARALN